MRTPGGPQALRAHVGACQMGKGKPIGRDQVHSINADGLELCPYCGPDTALGVLG
ncbi:DUF6233 domain-containing protein [Streptomyces cirratus]|uniref:DUF6233 domain-containing protein n=1 Tax=Streptomyces cirratus TaxID=68187 RepID=UPI003571283D